MAGLYGIANFADDFNRVRDSALDSGFKAKERMRQDWLGDYRMPEQMTASDAAMAASSIKADTLNQGYDDLVQRGVNKATLGARQSGIDLDKLSADETMRRLQGQAVQEGYTSPEDIASYVKMNMDYAEMAANPYLAEQVLGSQRRAGQQLINLGSALGGPVGDYMTTRGLGIFGYGLEAQRDAAGNLMFVDEGGRRTAPYARGGQVPVAQAFGGNVAPMAQYYNALDRDAAQSARLDAQLAQRDAYAQERFDTELEKARLGLEGRQYSADQRLEAARLRGGKGGTLAPTSIGASLITGGGGQGTPGTLRPPAETTPAAYLPQQPAAPAAVQPPPAAPARPARPAPMPAAPTEPAGPPSPLDRVATQIAQLQTRRDAMAQELGQLEHDFAYATSLAGRRAVAPETAARIGQRRAAIAAQLAAFDQQLNGLYGQGRTAPAPVPARALDIEQRYR